ncbi:MAG: cupin domain-containing protein [Hyphomicrobiales bacterium]
MSSLPRIISKHPQAKLSINGLNTRLIQAGDQQLIFMEFDNDVDIPAHSHDAQWGVVLDGSIEMIINGKKHTFVKGDSYYIKKDVIHSAKIKAGYKDLTLFDQADRYTTAE